MIQYNDIIEAVNSNRKIKIEAETRRYNKKKRELRRKKEVLTSYLVMMVLGISVLTGIIIYFLEKSQYTEDTSLYVEYIEPEVMKTSNEITFVNSTDEYEPNYNDYEYMAKCVLAEAGNQDEYGKRLVIDVILNRKENTAFPDTYEDIINQPNQFEVVENGSINEQVPNEYIYNLILQELEKRTDPDILYFKTIDYHDFAEPVIHHQDHYFSK